MVEPLRRITTPFDEHEKARIRELLDGLEERFASGDLVGLAVIEKRRSIGLEWSRAVMPDVDVIWGAQALIFRLMLERREEYESAS